MNLRDFIKLFELLFITSIPLILIYYGIMYPDNAKLLIVVILGLNFILSYYIFYQNMLTRTNQNTIHEEIKRLREELKK